jgi:valyl-tRNA synthetase
MVCPHCGHTFHPKETTSPAGYHVAAPQQECPNCKQKMVSGYGAAGGLASPSDQTPLARNTSAQFDLGRNFANKLYQVTLGFAVRSLSDKPVALPCHGVGQLPLVDRWIISRLHRTLHAVEDALKEYQLNVYAEAMYDFVWRDFCDWYVEAIKPTIKNNLTQQQVLRTVLNAIMRLLHPIMPFVTEALWPHVSACGFAGLDGIELPPSDLLASAPWPDIRCSVDDKQAVATFERVQNLTNAIRTVRAERQVPPKKKIRLAAPPHVIDLIKSAGDMVRTLALLETVEPLGGRPAGAIPLAFEGSELLLIGLVEQVDVEAEKARLGKVIAQKQRAIAGFGNKLSNAGYIAKAPPEQVQETRRLLAQAEADLAAASKALESLS